MVPIPLPGPLLLRHPRGTRRRDETWLWERQEAWAGPRTDEGEEKVGRYLGLGLGASRLGRGRWVPDQERRHPLRLGDKGTAQQVDNPDVPTGAQEGRGSRLTQRQNSHIG